MRASRTRLVGGGVGVKRGCGHKVAVIRQQAGAILRASGLRRWAPLGRCDRRRSNLGT